MKKNALLAALLAAIVVLPAMPIGAQERPARLREMLLVLDSRLVNIDFKEKPLEEVLAFFTQYTGVNLVISPILHAEKGDRDLDVTLSLKSVSVRSALEVILDLKGLAAVYRSGIIMITTPKDARGKPVLKLYSIGDLTMKIRDFPAPELTLRPSGAEDFGNIGGGEAEGRETAFADPEFIMDLVSENTGSGTWEDEGVRISVNDRVLVVRQYPTVHREIAALLGMLRGYR